MQDRWQPFEYLRTHNGKLPAEVPRNGTLEVAEGIQEFLHFRYSLQRDIRLKGCKTKIHWTLKTCENAAI